MGDASLTIPSNGTYNKARWISCYPASQYGVDIHTLYVSIYIPIYMLYI